MATPKHIFFNGKIVRYEDAKVGILTHALNYGTAVFGGIRGYWNKGQMQLFVFRPHDHYKRFLDSMKLMRMQSDYTKEFLTESTLDVIRRNEYTEDCYIRPLAFFTDEIIGVRLHNLSTAVSIAAVPFGRYVENEEGAHVTISSWVRVDDNIIPARGKIAGSYVNSAFAKSDAQLAGFDEAIVLDRSGHVSEGSAENIFMVRNGVFVTPSITENILEGIVRRTMMTFIQDDLGMKVEERSIDRTELYLADEVFFVGTGVQMSAITKIDNRIIGSGKMGPLTTKLRELFFNTVRGNVPKYRHWLMPVYKNEKGKESPEQLHYAHQS
ncbi:MAG TPA: branched-chain amino acid transaminase [Bacteroidota bacterium]|nr:branched-chain amino acid transaminase [Bacteroidota bacterium]